ncbi:vitellogenin-1-like [Lethenteron reissneri]|uniref:vitellogenin-1-like n=1 Tax=Lethenteron reissneri TaxID=7753 RepID=UPI002AB7ACD6|nr:vitellogenin-1-like [Lethenteron reissneri]
MSHGRLLLLHQPRLLLPPAPLPCLLLPLSLLLSLPSLLLLLLPGGTLAAVGPIYWNASNPQFQMDQGVIVFPKMGDRLDIICPRLPGAAAAVSSSSSSASSAATGSRVSSSSSKKSSAAAAAASSSAAAAGGSQISSSSSPKRSSSSSSSSSSSDHNAGSDRRSAGNMMDPKKTSRVETDDDSNDEKDELQQKKVEEAEEEVEEVEHGEEGETYRLYMVGREEARECDARRARNALLTCDRPGVEVKYTIKFQEYSPSVLGLEFRSGRDYYIICE